MTREAKMGLLLGLVFIVAIAVVLRGVHQNNDPLLDEQLSISDDVVTNDTDGGGEGMNLQEAVRQFEPPASPGQEREEHTPALRPKQPTFASGPRQPIDRHDQATGPAVGMDSIPAEQGYTDSYGGETRYVQELPGRRIADNITIHQDSGALERAIDNVTERPEYVDTVIAVVGAPQFQAKKRTYVVQKGDDLSKISMRFYGPREGNRWINVKRIYEANRKILSSMDELQIGQRLTIPALAGGRVPVSSSSTAAPAHKEAIPETTEEARTTEEIYVVKDGDSLWSIAEEKLGNGAQFKKIAQLNSNVLRDEDSIYVGMRLRLPERGR